MVATEEFWAEGCHNHLKCKHITLVSVWVKSLEGSMTRCGKTCKEAIPVVQIRVNGSLLAWLQILGIVMAVKCHFFTVITDSNDTHTYKSCRSQNGKQMCHGS